MHRGLALFSMALALALVAAGCGGSNVDSDDQASSGKPPLTPVPMPAFDPHPRVLVHTTHGDIVLRLDGERAPQTVRCFLDLVNSGHYDKTIVHQVEPGYVVLAGGYTARLRERESRYPIPNEAANGLTNRRGTVALARSPDAIDSATGQFFINLADNPSLDHTGESPETYGYCVFGEVVEGIEIVERIAQMPVRTEGELVNLPVETVQIESMRLLR